MQMAEKKEGIRLFQAFLLEFRSHWKIVLLVAVLASAALVGEKAFTKAPVVESTSLYIEQPVHVVYETGQPGMASYERLLASYGTFVNFSHETEGTFDYEKFQPGWSHMKDEEKSKWMKKHIAIDTSAPTLFVASIYISGKEWKDADYARENGRKILKAYLDYDEHMLKSLGQPVTFERGEMVEILPEKVVVSRRSLLGKYAVIGFVLGGLAACFVLLVFAVRKRHA